MKRLYFLIILFLSMVILPINGKAQNKVVINADKTDLQAGDEITITAKLESDKKLYALLATLSYDENVFDAIDSQSFKSSEAWGDVIYNEKNQKFGLINKTGEILDDLLQVTLKVKKDASVGNTKIILNNISASDGKQKYYFASSIIDVLVTKDATSEDVIENNSSEVKPSEDVVIKTMPRKIIMISTGICLVVLAASSLIFIFSKKDSLKKFSKIMLGATALVAMTTVYLWHNNHSLKDFNNDGVQDYDDAEDIIKYLIDFSGTKEEGTNGNLADNEGNNGEENKPADSSQNNKPNSGSQNKPSNNHNNNGNNNKPSKNPDVNGDGSVDVGDVAGSVDDVNKKNYKVTLTNHENEYYVEKNDITLEFTANVEPFLKIKEVVIDGKTYAVSDHGTYYSVNLTYSQFGVHEFKFTQVILENNKEVKVDFKIVKEVLKDAPYVDMFNVDEKTNSLKFKLEDLDNAFREGKVIILDDNNEEVLNKSIGKDNYFEVDFKENVTYTIKVYATYKLDTGNNDKTTFIDKLIYQHNFSLAKNYDFTLTDVQITDAISKGNHPIITFKSTNKKGLLVESITINNHAYKVALIDKDTYEVVLENIDTSIFGKYYLNIENITLSNLKVFTNEKDYELNPLAYYVLKYEPKVDNIILKDNHNDKNINVSYNLTNQENSLTDLKVVLYDSTGKVLDTKEIKKEEYNHNLNLSYGNSLDGHFYVKFLANYNLGTTLHNYQNKNIGENDLITQKEIKIINAKVTDIFPQKGQKKYTITFTLEIADAIKNSFTEFAGVTINGYNYDGAANGLKENKISFVIPNESGILELKVERVKLRRENYQGYYQEFFSVEPYIVKIDVLKDKPKINDLEIINEDYLEKNVTFKFNVTDDKGGFKSGFAELNGEKQAFNLGDNTLTFKNVPLDQLLDLNFLASYEADTNTLDALDNKNSYTDDLIYTVKYGLYNEEEYNQIEITNLNKNKNYYLKNEDIILNFDLLNLPKDLDIQKVILNEKVYAIEKEKDNYIIKLEGINEAGIKTLNITDIILDNGKKISLTNPKTIDIEVLKDKMVIKDFKYDTLDEDINVSLTLNDFDYSFVGSSVQDAVKIVIKDELGKEINTLDFTSNFTIPKGNLNRYVIEVIGNYDLDIKQGNDNYYPNQVLLREIISLDKNYIEIKNMTDLTLYKEENTLFKEIEEVDINDLNHNLEQYFVKITSSSMPTIYSKIKKVVDENNHLVLILDYDYTVLKPSEEELRIDFGPITSGKALNKARPESFEQFVQRVMANPSGSFTLTHDLDAKSFATSDKAIINIDFTGTLNGNGYKIKNLNKPLFKSLTGATIKDISFEDVTMPEENGKGTLAEVATKSHLDGILVNNYLKNNNIEGGVGPIVGSLIESSLTNSRAIGFTISSNGNRQQIGGLVGIANNAQITNSYAVGSILGGYNYRGGIAGNTMNNTLFQNNYTNVTINYGMGNGMACGIACGSNSSYLNNINLNTSAPNKIYYSKSYKESKNNYYLDNVQNLPLDLEGLNKITNEEVNDDLFLNKGSFDSNIWQIKNIKINNLPLLNKEIPLKINKDEVKEYDQNKNILYNNLALLMPYYTSQKIVNSAENIPSDSLLYQEEIKHIIPIDQNGNIVTYITKKDAAKIIKLKIVYSNDKTEEYSLIYDKTYDFVASYRLYPLRIDYTFDHYVIDDNAQIINNLTNYLNNLTYQDNLDPLTPTKDSRIYEDYYNEVTKKELNKFILKYIANSNYTNTSNMEAINDYLEKEIKNNPDLEKILYVYNYFHRFYNIDINGIKLNDLILFNSIGFDNNLTMSNIAKMYLQDESNFATNGTSNAYNKVLSNYTSYDNIPSFLDYLVKILGDGNTAKWFAQSFKGYLVEIKVDNRDDITYTLWDHIKNVDTSTQVNWYNYALPILTLPERAAYIISSPTQFIIGAQRTYITDPFNPADQKILEDKIESYTTRMKDYYETAAKILEDAKYFNDIHTVQIDKRYAYDQNGILTFQNPYSTEEPFHKNFNEVIGQWAYNDYNAATANGAYVIWRVEGLMDGNLLEEYGDTYEYTFHTWSHESAHNIDARLFLKNYGRRFNAGGEDYADGNLTQSFGEGDIVMNLSRSFAVDSKIATNLTPDRIASAQMVQDFYRKVFESLYIMDYLEGKAFLELSNEEKANIAVQANYPNKDIYTLEGQEYLQYKFTVYQEIDESLYNQMTLNTISDLYDNRLVIYPGILYSTYTDNKYGGENIFKARWYQPHNDYGRPDSYSLKWLAYEMLGYAGYDKGYVEYYSNRNATTKTILTLNNNNEWVTSNINNYKTDLMAIQTITNDPNMTIDLYKKNRFLEVENNLTHIQYIDVLDYYQKFLEALHEDAKTVKETKDLAWKQYPDVPDDEEMNKNNTTKRNNMIMNARQLVKSTNIRKELYYELKNKTNDFKQEIYNYSYNNGFSNFSNID